MVPTPNCGSRVPKTAHSQPLTQPNLTHASSVRGVILVSESKKLQVCVYAQSRKIYGEWCITKCIRRYSVFLAASSAALRASRLSHPRVIISLGFKSANSALHVTSTSQQPTKSAIITSVNRNLNCVKVESDHVKAPARINELTKSCITTICSHLFSSGTKSVEPENATALAPTKPQYKAGFSLIPSRNGRPWKLIANVDTCWERPSK